jgi:hypothetical protein
VLSQNNIFKYISINSYKMEGHTMKPIALSLIVILLLAMPVHAHHNYRLNFDNSIEITLEGVVTKVSWMNPHISIYLDVVDADGNVTNWAMPTAAPGVAGRNGMTAETLSVGDELIVAGWPARDGSNTLRARLLTLADGSAIPLHPTGERRRGSIN